MNNIYNTNTIKSMYYKYIMISDQLNKLDKLRRLNKFCDVVLVTKDNELFSAHKIMLVSQSKTLYAFFENNYNASDDCARISIRINSYVMEIILTYMYTLSDITLDELNFVDLLEAGFYLKIDYIVDNLCYNFIKTNEIESKIILDFMERIWFKYQNNKKIVKYIYPLIKNNFCELSKPFKDTLCSRLNINDIQNIISGDFACPSEEKVYDFILQWVRLDVINRKQYLGGMIFDYIRFPYLLKMDYIRIINEPLMKDHVWRIKSRMKEVLMDQWLGSPEIYENHQFDNTYSRRMTNILGKPYVIMAVRDGRQVFGTPAVSSVAVEYVSTEPGSKWKSRDCALEPLRRLAKIGACPHGLLYAVGGVTADGVATNDVEVFDMRFIRQNWIPRTPMNYPRTNLVVCVQCDELSKMDTRVYAIGGIDDEGQTLDTIEVFNVGDNTWRVIKMNSARSHHSAVYHDGFIYIVGGTDQNGDDLTSIECFDTVNERCVDKVHLPMPQGLYGACVAIMNDTLYVTGGFYRQGNEIKASSCVYQLSLPMMKWFCMKNVVAERGGGSIVTVDNGLYIFGGYNTKGEPTLETEVLDISETKYSMQFVVKPFSKMSCGYYDQNAFLISEKVLRYTQIFD